MQREELRQQQQRNTLVRSHKIAFDDENEGDANAPTTTTRGSAGDESHSAPNTPNSINNNTSGFPAPRFKRPRTAGSLGGRETVSPNCNGDKLVAEHSARSRIGNKHHETSSEEDHDDGDDEASPQQNRFGSSITAPSYKHKRAESPSASAADSDLHDKHRHHHRQHHNHHHQTHTTSKHDRSHAQKNRSPSEDMDDDSNGQQQSNRAHTTNLPLLPENAPNHTSAASAASAAAAAATAVVLNWAKQTSTSSSSSSSASSQQNPISRRQQQRQQQLLELQMQQQQQQQNSLPLSDRALTLLESASNAIPAVEWTNNSENAHRRSSTETPMALLNRQYYRRSTSRSRGGMSGDQSGAGSEVADLESRASRSQISSAASLPGVQSNANTTSAERVSASNRDDDAAEDAADRDGSNSSDSAASNGGRPNESGGEASQNQVSFSSSSSTGDSSSSGSNDDSRKSTGQKTGSSAGSGYCKTAVSNSDETEEESITGMNIDCSDSDRLALCEICRICEVDWAMDTDAQSSTTGWPEAFREFKKIREGTMFCFFKSNVWDVVRTSRSFRQAVVSLQLGVLELSANQNDLEWVAEPFSVAMQRDRRATVVLGRAAYRLLMKTEDTFKVIPRILTLVEMYFGALSRSLVSPSMPWPRFRVATEMTIYEEAVMTNLNLGTSNVVPSSTRAP